MFNELADKLDNMAAELRAKVFLPHQEITCSQAIVMLEDAGFERPSISLNWKRDFDGKIKCEWDFYDGKMVLSGSLLSAIVAQAIASRQSADDKMSDQAANDIVDEASAIKF